MPIVTRSQTRGLRYNDFPEELRFLIAGEVVDYVQKEGRNLAPFASLGGEWKVLVERIIFGKPGGLTIRDDDDLAIFEQVCVGKRLDVLTRVHFEVHLHSSMFTRRGQEMTNDIFISEASSVISSYFTRVLKALAKRNLAQRKKRELMTLSYHIDHSLYLWAPKALTDWLWTTNEALKCDFSAAPLVETIGSVVVVPPKPHRTGVNDVRFAPSSIVSLIDRMPNASSLRVADIFSMDIVKATATREKGEQSSKPYQTPASV